LPPPPSADLLQYLAVLPMYTAGYHAATADAGARQLGGAGDGVSRQVAFPHAEFSIIGIYRHGGIVAYGPPGRSAAIGRLPQISPLFGSAVLAAMVLVSRDPGRAKRVRIATKLFAYRYDYRS
jgi:hypothetical protein